jgi:hypothetical protein
MERDIDMRQTIEEAAKEYLSQLPWEEGDKLAYHICEFDFKAGFKSGAEWQAKQSPWVSVKDRLPPSGEEVLLFDINSIRHLVLGWLRENKGYNKSMWALSNGHVDDEDITHWMIIPENHG